MKTWTSTWPTEIGFYWFFGRRTNWSSDKGLYMVVVRKSPTGCIYIADGAFLYPSEGAEGVFQKAVVPALPEA